MTTPKCPKCSKILLRGLASFNCVHCGADLNSQYPEAQVILDMHRSMNSSESEHGQAKVDLTPEVGVYYYRRGAYYMDDEGDYDQAINNFSAAILLEAAGHRYASYCRRASCYVEKQDYEQAVKDWSKAIRLDPEDPFAWANRGLAYSELGRKAEEQADFSKVLELESEGKISRFS